MNKKTGFSILAVFIVLGGFYAYFKNHQTVTNPTTEISGELGSGQTKAGLSTPDKPAMAGEKSEPEKVFSAAEVSTLKQRHQEVNSQLDGLTKELDGQLENAEQRKAIEARYQQLAKEQNQLAIQLVKANQQAPKVE